MKEELESYIGIIIDGFKNGSRTFGPVRCYHTTINDEVKGAIIFIERTHHKILVLEVIAPICLRKTLNLKDGSKVWLKVNTKKML